MISPTIVTRSSTANVVALFQKNSLETPPNPTPPFR